MSPGRLVFDPLRRHADRHHASQLHTRGRQPLGCSPGQDAGQMVPGADRLRLDRPGPHYDLLAEDPRHASRGPGHYLGTGVDTDGFPPCPRIEGNHPAASLLSLGGRSPPRTALADHDGVAVDHLEADRATAGGRSSRRRQDRVPVRWMRFDHQRPRPSRAWMASGLARSIATRRLPPPCSVVADPVQVGGGGMTHSR